MKKLIITLTAACFILSTGSVLAIDKVPKDSGSSQKKSDKSSQTSKNKEYQPFIDKNNNGVDDRLESEQRKKTKVEPKRETEQKSESGNDKYKEDSTKNKSSSDSSKTSSKKESDKRTK